MLTNVLRSPTQTFEGYSFLKFLRQAKINDFDLGVGNVLLVQHYILWLWEREKERRWSELKATSLHLGFLRQPPSWEHGKHLKGHWQMAVVGWRKESVAPPPPPAFLSCCSLPSCVPPCLSPQLPPTKAVSEVTLCKRTIHGERMCSFYLDIQRPIQTFKHASIRIAASSLPKIPSLLPLSCEATARPGETVGRERFCKEFTLQIKIIYSRKVKR